MLGGTGWVDWYPGRVQSLVHGLGIEFEVRDVHLNRGYGQMNIRQDTAGGGPIYTPHVRKGFIPMPSFSLRKAAWISPHRAPRTRMTRACLSLQVAGSNIGSRVHSKCASTTSIKSGWQLPPNTPTPSGFTFGFAYRPLASSRALTSSAAPHPGRTLMPSPLKYGSQASDPFALRIPKGHRQRC